MGRPSESEFAWLMLIGILIMFLLALSVVLFFVFYQRRLFAQQSSMERLQLEEQKKQLENEIRVQENERERIARDLHDEVGTLLSTIKLYLTFEHKDSQVRDQMQAKSTGLIDEAISKLRAISKNLLPENLRLFGLCKTIERHCQQLNENGILNIQFEHQLHRVLNADTEMHLFRIIQELLNNAMKHAPHSTVYLHLIEENGLLKIHYVDNGPGMNPDKNANDVGLGLSSLRNRTQILQGEIKIDSEPGKGLTFEFQFPIFT